MIPLAADAAKEGAAEVRPQYRFSIYSKTYTGGSDPLDHYSLSFTIPSSGVVTKDDISLEGNYFGMVNGW